MEGVAQGLLTEFKDKAKFAGTIAFEGVERMEKAAIDTLEWIKKNQDADLKEYLEQKKTLLKTVEILMSKLILSAAETSSINSSTDEADPALGVTDERIKARNDFARTAVTLKNQFSDKTRFAGTYALEDINAMENAAINAIKWLDVNEDAELEDYLRQKKILLSTIETLMSKILQDASAAPPIIVPTTEAKEDDAATKKESTSKTDESTSTDNIEPEKDALPTKSEDKTRNERIQSRSELEKAAYALKDKLKDKTQFVGTSVYESLQVMEKAATDAIEWLNENEDADLEEYIHQKRKLSNTVETMVKKIKETTAVTQPPDVPTDEAPPENKVDAATETESTSKSEGTAGEELEREDTNEDALRKKRNEARSELESAASALKDELKDKANFFGTSAFDVVIELENTANNAIKWLDDNQDAELKDYVEQKKTFVATVQSLKTKLIELTDDTAEPTVDNAETESEPISESETKNTGTEEERIKARQELEKSARNLKSQFTDMNKFAGTVAYEGIKAMDSAANAVLKWLDENEDADLEDYVEQNQNLLNSMKTLISKMVQDAAATLPINVPTDETKPSVGDAGTESDSTEEIEAEEDEDITEPPTAKPEQRDEL